MPPVESITRQDVQRFTDALRKVLSEGDDKFKDDKISTWLLRTLVLGTAQQFRQYVVTRVPSGDKIAAPLGSFVDSLSDSDFVGKSLDAITSHSRRVIFDALIVFALPKWFVTFLLIIFSILGIAQVAGAWAGAHVIFAFFWIAGFGLPVGYWILQLLLSLLRNVDPSLATGLLRSAGQSLWMPGEKPEALFLDVAGDSLRSFESRLGFVGGNSLDSFRYVARTLLIGTYGLLAISIIYFSIGFFGGASEFLSCKNSPPSIFGSPRTDESCLDLVRSSF